MLKPEMIFGLWMEEEAVKHFEAHYGFHASTGELATRPGFRALDVFFEITDHSFPWWNKAHQNPASHFPNTWKFIQEEMEDKGSVNMAEMKRQQL